MTEVSVAFESKVPHTTPWIRLEHKEGHPPTEVLEALAEIGWKVNERYASIPPLDGVQELLVESPRGSALFGGWTESEKHERMPIVRAVLERYGFLSVPWNRLTYEDIG